MNPQHQSISIWKFLSGREYIPRTAPKSYFSGVQALGITSLFTALLFAISITYYIHLHIRYLTISIFVALVAGILVILFNRFIFQNISDGQKQTMIVWIGFLLFYGMLIFIFPEPFCYWYLQSEILQSKAVTGSSLSQFTQMIKVENTLGVEQTQSLQNFRLYLMLVGSVASLIPTVSHLLLMRKEESKEFLEIQNFRDELIEKILLKKTELAIIYDFKEVPIKKNEDPFALQKVEETELPTVKEKIEKLYEEIAHLEHLLDTI